MGILELDEGRLVLNMRLGILEEFKPSSKHKDLQQKIEDLRKKKEALNKQYSEVYNKEILPMLQDLKLAVRDINEERYPELKVHREKAEEAEKPTQAKQKAKTRNKRKK